MAKAIHVDERDNVATCLDNVAENETVVCVGQGVNKEITARQAVAAGHKIALRAIEDEAPIIKYGEMIGRAKGGIREGDWVHLHNCAEVYGESLEGRQN